MEIEPTLRKASGGGVLCGFRNKLREENGRWWHTRKWLVQSGFWLILINGLSVTAYFQLSKSTATFSWGELVGIFTGLLGWMAVFGVIILTQSEVVEERQTGTAEWVLSAPLSRASFIFSKVVVNLAWLLAILILLQGIVFSLVMDLLNVGTILWSDLLVGLALQGLGLAFWLCMSIMLGTFFKSRSAVIGVPLVFVFLQQFIPSLFGSLSSSVALVLPERLPEYSTNAFMGVSIPSAIPIITAAVLSVAFVLLAIVRFSREEFTGS